MGKRIPPTGGKFVPSLIVFGQRKGGKPQAAVFDALQETSAIKLAEKTGLKVLKVTTPDHRQIAAGLEQGKLYLGGDGSVPYVRQEIYDKVLNLAAAPVDQKADMPAESEAVSAAEAAQSSAESSQTPAAETAGSHQPQSEGTMGPVSGQSISFAGYPQGWETIKVGSLVLAQASLEDGWFEAIVVEQQEDLFRLQWRDYPKDPKFVRHRMVLGLMAPVPLS
jgi:hypothetical protein